MCRSLELLLCRRQATKASVPFNLYSNFQYSMQVIVFEQWISSSDRYFNFQYFDSYSYISIHLYGGLDQVGISLLGFWQNFIFAPTISCPLSLLSPLQTRVVAWPLTHHHRRRLSTIDPRPSPMTQLSPLTTHPRHPPSSPSQPNPT